jgi:hypothetical protein
VEQISGKPESAAITVKSEDGTKTETYTILFEEKGRE